MAAMLWLTVNSRDGTTVRHGQDRRCLPLGVPWGAAAMWPCPLKAGHVESLETGSPRGRGPDLPVIQVVNQGTER